MSEPTAVALDAGHRALDAGRVGDFPLARLAAILAAMSKALPRPVLFIGTPLLVAAMVGAVWAWAKFGAGVWFDTIATGFSACL